MKLKKLIEDFNTRRYVENDIRTKGNIIDWKYPGENYNLPYELHSMLPYLKEVTIFNVMQDGRRGMWVNQVYNDKYEPALIQFMFNREGDDNIFNFIIDKDYFVDNLDYELIANYMTEEEFESFLKELENVDYENYVFTEEQLDLIISWLELMKGR